MDASTEHECLYKFGKFCLDPINKSLTLNGITQKIQPKQFEILIILLKKSGELVPRALLIKLLWPDVLYESLSWQISELRKVLKDKKAGPKKEYKYIATNSKQGYTFVAPVQIKSRKQRHPHIGKKGDKKRPAPTNRPSLAVLPFQGLGSGSRDKYLRVGIAEAITAKLSALRELMVRQHESVLRCCAKESDSIVIAQKLRVKWLLEGEIVTSDSRISVAVKLTNVAQNRSIWSRQFWENERDPFEIHDAIAAEVAKQLLSNLSQRSAKLLLRRPTESLEAQQLYVNGRNYWNQRTETGLLKAIEYFNRATNADAEFAPAYAGLADCYNLLSYYGGLAPKDAFPKALAFADKALEIDNRLAEAHTSRAYAISRFYWEWKQAEHGYQKAIEFNPSYPSAHQWFAEHLTAMGRFEEAQREVREARALDPLSLVIAAAEGTVFYFARRYDEAIEHYRKIINDRPDFVRTRFRLARAYLQKGMFKEAIKECKYALKLPGKTKELAQLGQAYAMAKQPSHAKKVIARLEQMAKTSYVSEYNVAIIYVGLGDFAEAFRWLEKAFTSHDPWLEHLNVDPRLDAIRTETRFGDLLRRIDYVC